MKWYALALLVISTASFTQEPIIMTDTLKVKCGTVRATESCNSFNEMVQSKDKDLLSVLSSKTGMVCFRPDEDMFFVISIYRPSFDDLPKNQTSDIIKNGMVYYQSYHQGTTDTSHTAYGKWTKTPYSDEVTFSSSGATGTVATVDDSEIFFGFEYPNIGRGTTHYSAQVRRSTLRFLEDYQWTIKSKDPKATSRSTEEPANRDDSHSGYCRAF